MKILSNILVRAGVIVDNYIAIGTNSPFAGYNIDSRGSHNFGNTSTEVYHYFQSSSVSGGSTLSVYVNNTSANSSRSHIMLADTAASVPSRFGLGVFTGETPYAYLDSASKLVINNASGSNVIVGGTTDNGYKFQVNGDITAGVYRGANGAPLATFDAATSRVKIDAQGYGSTTGHSLIVSDYLSVEARAVFNANLKAKGANNTITYGITRPDAPALDSVSIAGIGPLFSDPWYTGLGLSFYVSQSADISTGGGLAEKFRISANGDITAFNLAGSGNRMVIVNSSGVLSTQAIPSISNYVTTDTTQTISGQKTFSALTTIFDSTQTATFIEGKASGVLYGGMSFSLYMQFNAYAAATGGYLWKNGAGDNVMALSQAGALTITNLAGSGDRMVVADSNGVLTTQAIPSGGTSASTRTIQKFTSTASQTTFTITGGYTVGMVDVFLNGVKIDNATDFTATNGTTVVLTEALAAGQTVEVYKYGSQFIVNNGLRQTTLFSATAAQTTFTVNYSVGMVDVFYNGSKLDSSEYTATNGTSIVLGTACAVNDKVEVIAYSYNVGAFTGIGGSGTINYIPKFTASGTLGNSIIWDNGTNVGIGNTNTTFTFDVTGTGRFTGALTASTTFTLDGTKKVFLRSNQTTGGGLLSGSALAAEGNFSIYSDSGVAGEVLGMYYWNGSTYRSALQFANVSSGSSNLILMKDGGNIGIGTTSPQQRLHVEGDVYLANNRNLYFANTGVAAGAIRFYNATSGTTKSAIGSYYNVADEGNLEFLVGSSLLTKFMVRSNGRSIFNSTTDRGYQLQVNGDASSYAVEFRQSNDSASYDLLTLTHEATSGNRRMMVFNTGGIGTVGTIISTNSSTTYNTTSDYRLKEDLKDFNGLDLIKSMKTYDFKWKADNSRMYGVMAHELADVLPYAVYGDKDGEYMQGVDYSKLTPVLVKAIQEEDLKVNAHEVRIAELEQEVTTLKSQIAQFGSN